MSLDLLKKIDELEECSVEDVITFIHKEHRFVLAILNYCQNNKILPKPCNVILFDAHHDFTPLANKNDVLQSIKKEYSDEEMINICNDYLNKLDDDWVTGGFELGIIGDILIFGVEKDIDGDFNNCYMDNNGGNHKIYIFSCLPIDELHSRGVFIDIPKMDANKDVMDIIEWGLVKGNGFKFTNYSKKLALIIDLDCFIINYKDETFPWPDELFEKKFLELKGNLSWSGQKFMEELHKKLGVITIAKEPSYCGDERNVDVVLNKISKYIFNGKLVIRLEKL